MSKNKYKNLIGNTMLFGISTFGSKMLNFLLLRLLTEWMTTSMMSSASLITSVCNFILPVMYVGIAESVIRFAMDSAYKKSDVFAIGFNTVVTGYLVLWCFYPLISRIEEVQGYTHLVYLYVITSALRTLVTQFVRASGFVRLFAIDGIFTTLVTAAGYVIFLVPLDLGVSGYLLATIVGDGLSACCLFFMLRLYRFIKIRGIDHGTIADMFRYSIPMVPTAIFWSIINLSDLFFVKRICGPEINGLYVVAYKIPGLITMVSAIFTRAWELSAFTEYKSEEGERFFSNVFRTYYTFVFLVASALILLIKPIISIFTSSEYFEAWRYSPLLILAVSFSCLVTFLGAIYNAVKMNRMISVTTFIGAAVNILLNMLLIPKVGAQGAAFATFVSYFIVFLIRAVDTRRFMRIRMQPLRIAMNLVLLLLQIWVALTEPSYWIVWESLIFLLLVACNFGYILFFARRLLSMLPSRKKI